MKLGGRSVSGFALGKASKNEHFFDRYSIPHAAVGAVMETVGVPPPIAIASHVVFEAIENSLKRAVKPIWPDSRPDGWQNHVGDMASFTGGMLAARSLKETEGGKVLLTGLVATAGAVWMWNLAQRHSWQDG